MKGRIFGFIACLSVVAGYLLCIYFGMSTKQGIVIAVIMLITYVFSLFELEQYRKYLVSGYENYYLKMLDKKSIDLNEQLKAVGLMTILEMKKSILNNVFMADADVVDLKSFRAWLHMKDEEFSRMQAELTLKNYTESELFEWIMAHCATFSEVLVNLERASKHEDWKKN